MASKYIVKREICPACHTNDSKVIYSLPYEDVVLKEYLTNFYTSQGGEIDLNYLKDQNFNLLNCNTCDLVYQEYIPNDELMFTLYNHWINPEKTLERTENFGFSYFNQIATEVISILRHFNKKPKALDILDFGMGWGKWIQMVKAMGANAYGLELSDKKIEVAKANGIKLIAWDDLYNSKFDYIHTEQVFEHIPNPLTDLKLLVNALKKDGIIKISVPNGGDIKSRLAKNDWQAPKGSINSLNSVAPLEHINCFSSASIIKMAALCKLRPVELPLYHTHQNSLKNASIKTLKSIYNRVMKPSHDHTALYFVKSH